MRVNGKGISILEAAGIEVKVGVLSDRASLDHAGFFILRVSVGLGLL